MGIWNWLYRGGIRHWLYQGDGVDLQGCVMRAPDWIRVIESKCGGMPWGRTSLAGSGRWDWIMGICDNGWIGAMDLFHGDTRHWLEQGNGLIYSGVWHWLERVMGLIQGACHGGTQHWLDQGDGIDTSWGHTTGSGRWDWFEGARYWDVMLAGTRHGGTTGSERWDWFVDYEIVAMGLIHGACRMAKYYMVAECKWQSTIWLLNVNDDTMCLLCLMSGVEVSVQSVFG